MIRQRKMLCKNETLRINASALCFLSLRLSSGSVARQRPRRTSLLPFADASPAIKDVGSDFVAIIKAAEYKADLWQPAFWSSEDAGTDFFLLSVGRIRIG